MNLVSSIVSFIVYFSIFVVGKTEDSPRYSRANHVSNGPVGSGTNVQLWPCTGDAHQQWNFPPDVNKYITLKSDSTLCLEVENYQTQNGANVRLLTCHPSDTDPSHQNQAWAYTNSAVISTLSSRCLDATGQGITGGTNIQIYDCSGGTNQQWIFNATDGTIRGVQSKLCLDAGSYYPPPCSQDPEKSLPFCNISLAISDRVKDLISRLSLDDKVGLFGSSAGPVPSLHLPPYQWWNEGLHGLASSPGVSYSPPLINSTSFPQVIGLGASFDRALWGRIGSAISSEARAFANIGQANLTYWAPNINIFRDPRWGRGQETTGEDPYLNGEYAAALMMGLQNGGDDARYLKVSGCCKHYAGYSLENSGGTDRDHFNGIITTQDWTDTYLPAFQSCVQKGKATGIMCSYNSNNGIPSCADHNLLTDKLRNTYGFTGYVTGDCGAVADVLYTHSYTNTTQDTCASVLSAGLDLDCGIFLQSYLPNAISTGTVTESVLNGHLTNLFSVQFRLGIFDPAEIQPYRQIPISVVNSVDNQNLALLAARESIVLLSNNNILPFFSTNIKSIAVIGPNANATTTLQGNYYGVPPYLVSPLQGLSKYVTTRYSKGCEISSTSTAGFNDAVNAAKAMDATVMFMGLDQTQEGEGLDRTSITLPGVQSQLISQVAASAKGPVVVVLMAGSSLDVSTIRSNPSVGAILFVGYPGQSGGQAIAEVLFGDYNPAGRLPVTFHYGSFITEVAMTDMGMRPNTTTGNPGRTYRFYTGKVVYEFGYGLSYTTFNYTWITTVSTTLSLSVIDEALQAANGSLVGVKALQIMTVKVTNTGNYLGDDIVLAFVVPANPGKNGNPLKNLIGFDRIRLYPGQSQYVSFEVPASAFTLTDVKGIANSCIGDWVVQIGVGSNMIEHTTHVE